MIKNKKVTETIEKTEVVDILCNLCGKTCNNEKRYFKSKKSCYYEGIENLQLDFGYGSKFFGDMTSIKFSLCEECIFDLVKKFKIPHDEKNEFTSDYISSDKMKKIIEKEEKNNHKEWVTAVLLLQKELGVKKFNKKVLVKIETSKLIEMYNKLYYELTEKKRKESYKTYLL
jgi:hypothetical protein